jgi:hypothetical protein
VPGLPAADAIGRPMAVQRLLPGRRSTPSGPPASALTAIKVIYALVPAAATTLAMIVFFVYPLTDERFRQIRDETEARKRQFERALLGEEVTIDRQPEGTHAEY